MGAYDRTFRPWKEAWTPTGNWHRPRQLTVPPERVTELAAQGFGKQQIALKLQAELAPFVARGIYLQINRKQSLREAFERGSRQYKEH